MAGHGRRFIAAYQILSGQIYLGQPNAAGTAFRDGKEQATEEVLFAAAEYLDAEQPEGEMTISANTPLGRQTYLLTSKRIPQP